MPTELFELCLYGEGVERRYRKMRPEVETMPWGTFDRTRYSPPVLLAARAAWTAAAFQEHRTGVGCTIALRALMEARAPLDLIALVARFPLDEMVHVELCAKMAMELGGATPLRHDPDAMVVEPDPSLPPLVRAADAMVRFFCVGEAVSIPLLRGAWHAATQPLPRAILGRVVRDEAAHGTIGWSFLEWAMPRLTDDDKAFLRAQALRGILSLRTLWRGLRENRPKERDESGDTLGWFTSDAYARAAETALVQKVLNPLARAGLPIENLASATY